MAQRKVVSYYNGRYQGAHLSDETCDILDTIIELSAQKGVFEDLKHMIYNLSEEDVAFVLSTGEGIDNKPLGELKDYQTVACAFLYYSKRALLGDSVGLGKTASVAAALNLLSLEKVKAGGAPLRFLFLTEGTSVPQLQKELVRFTGEYVGLLKGEKAQVLKFAESSLVDGNNTSMVGPHSLLRQANFFDYVRMFRDEFGQEPFDVVVIDESGMLGNTATQTYKGAQALHASVEYVFILNATPFESNLSKFYAQLAYVDPTLLPTKSTFETKHVLMDYSGAYPTPSGKYKDQDEFRHNVGYRYLAQTRKSLGAKFTNCTAEIRKVGMSSYQSELMKMTSMSQMVLDCPWAINPQLPADRNTTPKLGALLDYIVDDLDGVNRVLVYVHYKDAQQGISDYLWENTIPTRTLNGDMTFEEKQEVIQSFKDGEFRVLLTNVQKGLNFGECNHSVFYSTPGNTNQAVQFEGRTTRSFDIDDKHVVVLLTKGPELKRFEKVLAERAQNSDAFAGSDYSMFLTLMLEKQTADE